MNLQEARELQVKVNHYCGAILVWTARLVLLTTVIYLFIIAVSGCAISESSESLSIPYRLQDGTESAIVWESKIWQGLFLYWTKTKQIHKETPFTLTSVGEMESMPDPNSIETVGNIGALLIRP